MNRQGFSDLSSGKADFIPAASVIANTPVMALQILVQSAILPKIPI